MRVEYDRRLPRKAFTLRTNGARNEAFVQERTTEPVDDALKHTSNDARFQNCNASRLRCNCIHCSPPRHARRAFNLHIPDTIVDLNRECFYGPTNDKHGTTRNVSTHVNRVCCTILSMPTALLSYAPLRVRTCCFVIADDAAECVQYRNT